MQKIPLHKAIGDRKKATFPVPFSFFKKYIAILFIHMLNYDKAYFQKESKVYITINILATFQKSMLLYQSIVKSRRFY